MSINLLGYAKYDQIGDLVYEPDLLWKKQDVTLAFVNGDKEKRLYFRRIYFQWFLPTHIHFKEIPLNHGADIRVGFGLDNQRSWSLIGSNSAIFSYNLTSCKIFRDYQKTNGLSLVVAFNTKRDILHEGAHSIGFNHEHFHALANISWKQAFIDGSINSRMTLDFIQNNYLRKFPLNKSLGGFDT
jgi:hypothetical protein